MNYYKDHTNAPRCWATAALLLYGGVLAALFLTVGIELPVDALSEAIEVELAPAPEPQPQPVPKIPEPQMHDEPAAEEQNNAVRGEAPATQTVNPRALFRQSQSGPDEPENAGNPRARRADEDAASGRGTGSSPEGSDQLDKGLQGRGLVGALPKPRYSANEAGKVVIRVAVDRTGKVTDATYEPKGSTISNPELIEEARKAALQARFTESRSFVQGGTITYLFTLKR